jgi:hypothetical protein
MPVVDATISGLLSTLLVAGEDGRLQVLLKQAKLFAVDHLQIYARENDLYRGIVRSKQVSHTTGIIDQILRLPNAV